MNNFKESVKESSSLDFAEEFDVNEFKIKLNSFMIENAPSEITIGQVEKIMVDMIDAMLEVRDE